MLLDHSSLAKMFLRIVICLFSLLNDQSHDSIINKHITFVFQCLPIDCQPFHVYCGSAGQVVNSQTLDVDLKSDS